jgi:hypothetical protein
MTWDLPALLPIQEESVLRIFIALENPSPWPGSNLQTLGPVASTLTTTPPRRLTNTRIQQYCYMNLLNVSEEVSSQGYVQVKLCMWVSD